MHFVTGGAFNGKSAWVKTHYQLVHRDDWSWISAYKKETLPLTNSTLSKEMIVLEGIEQWIRQLVETYEDNNLCREQWSEKFEQFLLFTQESSSRKVIVIGTDISKGIVPIELLDRRWRDVTGWVYQDIVKIANRVDIIWYGCATRLK